MSLVEGARQLGEVKNTIEVTLAPKDELFEDQIAFTWSLTEITEAALLIQINFANP